MWFNSVYPLSIIMKPRESPTRNDKKSLLACQNELSSSALRNERSHRIKDSIQKKSIHGWSCNGACQYKFLWRGASSLIKAFKVKVFLFNIKYCHAPNYFRHIVVWCLVRHDHFKWFLGLNLTWSVTISHRFLAHQYCQLAGDRGACPISWVILFWFEGISG